MSLVPSLLNVISLTWPMWSMKEKLLEDLAFAAAALMWHFSSKSSETYPTAVIKYVMRGR